MSLGTITSVAQTLFAALQCSKLRQLFSFLGYKSQLDKLEETVKTVKAVLSDAEARDDQEFTHQAQLFIEQLKEVVYDADDLLDEFITIAQRKHSKLFNKGATTIVPDKLRGLFYRIKDVPFAYKMSHKVKEIRKKLDDIADNHNKFGFKIDSQPIRKRREGTYSYVYTPDIIGRDGDKEKIVGMLLDPNVTQDVSFLTIVGIGGLGKTTLAQLVYNDETIQKAFPTRLWACVGDDDPNHLNVNLVLSKILGSTSGHKSDESTPDSLGDKVRKCLAGKKYLLVLDDIWNENRHHWLKLEAFLKGGSPGSWVLVTTRSAETAKIIGDGSLFELEGLSNEDSWRLFEKVAFGQEGGQANLSDLVEIGKKIVQKCANSPLAIRVAGSLLYGQDKDKWSLFEQNGLFDVSPKKNDILSILKFSYHHLDSPLKSCISYCALFPKDYRIQKDMLISLWMAQGFIVPLEKHQSMEDAGEEYVLILLRRCFFQDVEIDTTDEIFSFKLHDLMHDVVQEVSKNEISAVDCITGDLDKKIRHLSVAKHKGTVGSFTKSTVRTLLYLCWRSEGLSVGKLVDNWMSLRALDLSNSDAISLPDQISNLLHLRYLDLSKNRMLKILPKSLTKLHNLETLILKDCRSLIELPNDFCKLVKLRCLDTWGCDSITHMPASIDKLSCLHKLTMFAVELRNPDYGDVLKGLLVLTRVKGGLEIRMKSSGNSTYDKRNSGELERGYLMNKQRLNRIQFVFERANVGKASQEPLMEDMQPYHELESLSLRRYKGEKLPSWARGDNLVTSLPNLVEIQLWRCNALKYLGPLGKLSHLRSLKLNGLRKLEYIGEKKEGFGIGAEDDVEEESLSFPSLQVLKLRQLPRLKGWWRQEEEGVADNDEKHEDADDEKDEDKDDEDVIDVYDDDDDDEEDEDEDNSNNNSNHRRRQPQVSPIFFHLYTLEIRKCPELILIFEVPKVEEVELKGVNEKLRVRGVEPDSEWEEEGGEWLTYYSSSSNRYDYPSPNSLDIDGNVLREVNTDNVGCITSLPCITDLVIDEDKKVERLAQVRELWLSCSSSLRILSIINCKKLKSVVKGGLENLTALEELQIACCPNVTLNPNDEDGDGDGEGDGVGNDPSLPFLPTLRSLEIDLPKVVNLPKWMQHLTSLHSLSINGCSALKSLPEWMPHLTSLTYLCAHWCSEELERRCCKSPPGQDWHNIQHIPRIEIRKAAWIL